MHLKDYYRILELETSATQQEIKKLTGNWPSDIILIKIPVMHTPLLNLQK